MMREPQQYLKGLKNFLIEIKIWKDIESHIVSQLKKLVSLIENYQINYLLITKEEDLVLGYC